MNGQTIFGLTTLHLQFWSAVVGSLVVLVIVLAWWQLRSARKATYSQLLLNLDSRWEPMSEARSIVVRLANDILWKLQKVGYETYGANSFEELITKEVRENKTTDTGEHLRKEFNEKIKSYFSSTKEEDIKAYSDAMAMCSFFETIGSLVERRYLPIEDAYNLYGGAIFCCYEMFKLFIKDRQATSPSWFEHLTTLGRKCSRLERINTHKIMRWPIIRRAIIFVYVR